jgi:hypothetical protein
MHEGVMTMKLKSSAKRFPAMAQVENFELSNTLVRVCESRFVFDLTLISRVNSDTPSVMYSPCMEPSLVSLDSNIRKSPIRLCLTTALFK